MDFPLLQDVPADDVRELLSIARRRTFGKGEIVFHRGDPADTVHLISKGHFATKISTPRGDSALLAVLGPGSIFGEMAIISEGGHRSATIHAMEGGETFSVLRTNYLGLQKRHPQVAAVLLNLLADRLRDANERIVAAHYLDADERVRWALVMLSRAYGTEGESSYVVPLTQEQLAEIAGVARPTLNRVLQEEVGRGLIELQRGKVLVLDRESLAKRIRGMPHPV
jgi:CRP/FNR family cyclic AMP-dependent transcriptional regulator